MSTDPTVAERMRRYRARLRGEDVPRRRPGPQPKPVVPQPSEAERDWEALADCHTD
jgi:hypothetical protein